MRLSENVRPADRAGHVAGLAPLPVTMPPDRRIMAGQGSRGERLRRLRNAIGLTQEQLASRAGIRSMTVSEIERGVSDGDHETLEAVAEVVGVRIGALMDFLDRGRPLTEAAARTTRPRPRRTAFRVTTDSLAPWVCRGDTVVAAPCEIGADPTLAVALVEEESVVRLVLGLVCVAGGVVTVQAGTHSTPVPVATRGVLVVESIARGARE